MKTILKAALAATLSLFFASGAVLADEAAIAKALASEHRTDADRERDSRSKPADILGLLDLQLGDDVIDIMGGGGYYTVLMASITGPDGSAVLHNNTPYSKFVEKDIQVRFIDQQVPGVRVLKSEVDALGFEKDSFDAALMVMSYHDLYYHNPERGWDNTDVKAFFKQVHEALRPGGKLLIVDHNAAPGTGNSTTQTLHRIEGEFAQQDIESSGFKLLASSDVLRNPDDDYSKMVFDKSVRGTTDRFVMLFSKN